MSHCYASVSDFKSYLIDGGDSTWTQSDSLLLTLLEGSSRRIDEWCDRSRFGSGFGPRLGTNRYDPPDSTTLDLVDDLLTITSVGTIDTFGGGTVAITENTDFLKVPYDTAPYRHLSLTGGASFGAAQAGNVVTGTWGYSSETYALGTVSAGTAAPTDTTIAIGGGSAYAGQTLLIGTEQLYVTASGGTATVVRGVNGTTAGTAALGTAISAYRYPREVVTACLQLTARRHRMAQAGLTGDFGGGGGLPLATNRDNEHSILKGTIGHLRFIGVG